MKPAATAPAAALLLVVVVLASAAGVASGLNLTSFDDFDRVFRHDDDVPMVPACKPHQVKTAERCAMSVPPVRVEHMSCGGDGDDGDGGGLSSAPVPHTFYYDVVETLALSAYIYEVTKIRARAREANDTELHDSFETPLSFRSLHGGIRLIKDDKEAEVQEAIELLEAYNADDDLLCVRDSTMGEEIIKIGDDESDVEMSRVHMIAVDHVARRVDVVFRGSSNRGDWSTNFNALWRRRVPNPVGRHNAGGTKHVHLHRGFARALLGDATSPNLPVAYDIACGKDEGVEPTKEGTPMQAILCDIKPFMEKGYRLHVTGHSLGGATATLFAFFAASADPYATRAGPVQLFTYASPRVGGSTFQDAFKFLEERGKIRHARFRNQKDRVPMLPWLVGKYSHVGVEFRLRRDEIPIVDYPIGKTWEQKGLGLAENALTLHKVLVYHKPGKMLERIKASASVFNATSLQQEYQMIWGL